MSLQKLVELQGFVSGMKSIKIYQLLLFYELVNNQSKLSTPIP